MNSSVSNTSTPFLSQECDVSTFPGVIAGCQAESGFWAGYKGITNELRACDSTNSCTPEQKQERFKIVCPVIEREYDCMKPLRDCIARFPDRFHEFSSQQDPDPKSECDAFSASSGSTNTTTSGNGTPTNTTTSGNGKPTNTTTSGNGTKVVSAGFSIQGSLISILAFALLL